MSYHDKEPGADTFMSRGQALTDLKDHAEQVKALQWAGMGRQESEESIRRHGPLALSSPWSDAVEASVARINRALGELQTVRYELPTATAATAKEAAACEDLADRLEAAVKEAQV